MQPLNRDDPRSSPRLVDGEDIQSARPMTRPRFLRRPRTWFSRSRFILTSNARLASSALTAWLSSSLTPHFLEPAGLHDASDASRVVAVVLIDLHLQHRFRMPSIDTDDRQVKPRELGPKPRCGRSSLKADPNRTRCFRPHEPSNRFGESTTPSRTTDPFSFTTQIDVCFNDTSSPTKYSIAPLHRCWAKWVGPSIPGELIPCAFVWLDPGITPCCKSRKSNNPKNLAKVELWTSLLLRRFSAPLRRSVIDLYAPASLRAKRISGSKNFRSSSQKNFSTLSPRSGHRQAVAVCSFRAHELIQYNKWRPLDGCKRVGSRL